MIDLLQITLKDDSLYFDVTKYGSCMIDDLLFDMLDDYSFEMIF